MMEIFDKSYKRIAILENVFEVKEEINKNGMSYMDFSIPADDYKNEFCESFNFVKYNGGQVYRIMPKAIEISEQGIISYECEHAIATLIDDVMFGYHVVGNLGYYTKDVIQYVLSKQEGITWVLGECDFNRQFEYGWEQENLLSALFAIPKPFTDDYMWEYDTDVFPFKLSLRKIDMNQNPSINIRKQKNTLRVSSQSDPKNICTRLYPLGYGEGVNQLNIKNLNNGVPYIQSSPDIVKKYGIIQRIWTDRRYENEESLFNAGKAMLGRLEKLMVDYEVDFVDVDSFEKAEIGKVARIIDTENGIDFTTLITGLNIEHSDITRSTISISENAQSIAGSVADMADRQRIETTYAQGATQLYAQNLQANADTTSGAVMNFFIPHEMRIVNKVLIKIKLESFRSYSKATEGGGSFNKSTADGGGVYKSTESGGGEYMSTENGGSIYTTTGNGGGVYTSTNQNSLVTKTTDTTKISAGSVQQEDDYTNIGKHNHGIEKGVSLAKTNNGRDVSGMVYFYPSGAHNHGEHSHNVTLPTHVHNFEIDNHEHSIQVRDHVHDLTIRNHSHLVKVDAHNHSLKVDNHDHNIVPGIYRFGNARGFTLRVNMKTVAVFNSTSEELDITRYLLNQYGNIERGNWQSIEVLPNDLAYVSIDLMLQGFVQSRGTETV